MDDVELKRLEMRIKFGSGNEELDLVQLDALGCLIAEVRRLRGENERLKKENGEADYMIKLLEKAL